jgi:hypothetical protein
LTADGLAGCRSPGADDTAVGAPATPRVHDPRQIVMALDHDVQNTSPTNHAKYARIAAFARDQGILAAFPAGRGIGHQVMVEEGFVLPDTLCVASDSHANMYGGLGCLGTPVVRTDAVGWVSCSHERLRLLTLPCVPSQGCRTTLRTAIPPPFLARVLTPPARPTKPDRQQSGLRARRGGRCHPPSSSA